jgi:cytochrome c oxidase subunit II
MQSALDPAGREAETIFQLFQWMTWGAVLIWLGVIVLAWYAQRARAPTTRGSTALIVGGGVVFPVIVLLALMVGGLSALPEMLAPSPDDNLSIEISASQWWWRVKYLRTGQSSVELANEIHLPVGRRINARLISTDVIHSFWAPSIAGKLDMIPGRTNRLSLEPTRTGIFRGACAEFCGTSHGLMNFIIVVSEAHAFSQWLTTQGQLAVPPSTALAQRGLSAFHEHGCNTCHTIRGADAFGTDGPDLTHVGSRQTLAAGVLASRPEDFQRWIASTELLKPGAHMPAFANLPRDTLAALAAYLTELQ